MRTEVAFARGKPMAAILTRLLFGVLALALVLAIGFTAWVSGPWIDGLRRLMGD